MLLACNVHPDKREQGLMFNRLCSEISWVDIVKSCLIGGKYNFDTLYRRIKYVHYRLCDTYDHHRDRQFHNVLRIKLRVCESITFIRRSNQKPNVFSSQNETKGKH